MEIKNVPFVTIGITCYNAIHTIDRAVASALSQDWPNAEILIVDDGSKDGSPAHLLKLAALHPSIRVHMRDVNGGCAAARNTLLEQAHGDYICFMDDDDESSADRVTAQYRRLSAYVSPTDNAPVFCFVSRIVRKNEDASTDVTVLSAGYKHPEPCGDDYACYMFLNVGKPGISWGQTGIGTCMALRSDFLRFGGFNDVFKRGEEWDFFIRAAMNGACFISTPAPLMVQHVTHTEDKAGKISLNYALFLRRQHKAYLQKKGIYLASICAAYGRFYYARGQKIKSVIWTLVSCVLSPGRALKYHWERRFPKTEK